MGFVKKNECSLSSSQFQPRVSVPQKKPFSLLLVMMVLATTMQWSVAVAQTCPRTRSSGCREYVESYDKDVPQQVKVLDAVDAQLSYINLAEENGNNDKVRMVYIEVHTCQPADSLIFCLKFV